jgi:hypothetical protein
LIEPHKGDKRYARLNKGKVLGPPHRRRTIAIG